MKIQISFKAWDTKRDFKYIYTRLWLGAFWTPFVKMELRQPGLFK